MNNVMIRLTILLIFRNFKRFSTTFLINLIGLSTGLACTLLIYLRVRDELNMDQFHENAERLLKVMESQEYTGTIRVTDSTPWLLAEALGDKMPEVESAVVATPTHWFTNQSIAVKDNTVKANAKYAGKEFFKILVISSRSNGSITSPTKFPFRGGTFLVPASWPWSSPG